jgi:hypothetical protein
MFPDLVDPNMIDPASVHTSLQAAIASFLTLAFGGMGHKVVKKGREKNQVEEELEQLKKRIQEYENSR